MQLLMDWTAACLPEPTVLHLLYPPPRARARLRKRCCAAGRAYDAAMERRSRLLLRHTSTGPPSSPERERLRGSWNHCSSGAPPQKASRGPRLAGAVGTTPQALAAVAADVRYRPAVAEDLGTIQRMVLSEAMNPLSLDWRRFLVAEAAGGPEAQAPATAPSGAGLGWSIVGIGQLKRWSPDKGSTSSAGAQGEGGILELRSLVVSPSYRGQGIGGLIARKLLERAAQGNEARDGLPVYLLTIGKRVRFYERLGFQEVSEAAQVPPQLRFELLVGSQVARLVAQDRCLCMKLSSANGQDPTVG